LEHRSLEQLIGRERLGHGGAVEVGGLQFTAGQEALGLATEELHGGVRGLSVGEQVEARGAVRRRRRSVAGGQGEASKGPLRFNWRSSSQFAVDPGGVGAEHALAAGFCGGRSLLAEKQ
jgi:hypothetical protein